MSNERNDERRETYSKANLDPKSPRDAAFMADLTRGYRELEHAEAGACVTEVIELRLRVRVNVPQAQAVAKDFHAADLTTLVSNEIISTLQDQSYVVEIITLSGVCRDGQHHAD